MQQLEPLKRHSGERKQVARDRRNIKRVRNQYLRTSRGRYAPGIKPRAMSEKDKELIDKAWKVSCFNWEQIDVLIEKAESQETKDRLRNIQKHKYHLEECKCGLD